MSKSLQPMSDAGLWRTLKDYDPIMAPSPLALAHLEAAILARIDQAQDQTPAAEVHIPVWFTQRGWTTRATLIASALVVVLGFVAGQVSSMRGTSMQTAMSPSLYVLANETALLPTSLIASGDIDEDDE